MDIATVITIGQSESIQLPAGFHIGSKEVYVKRVGKTVILIPTDVNPWDLFERSLGQFTDDYMQERRQPQVQTREDAFE